MDTDLPVSLSPGFLRVTRVRAQVGPRVCAPNLPHSVIPRPAGRWATRAARSTLRAVPPANPTPGPPPTRSQRPTPGPPRSAPLAPPLRPAARSLGGSRGSRGSSGKPSCLHGDAASQARSSEPSAGGERVLPSWSALRGISLAGSPAGKQRRGDCWGSGAPRLPKHRPRSLGPEFCIPEIPRNYLDKKDVKASKSRQNGTLLVFNPKEKVMIDPNKAMPQCFGRRPRLASKLYSSPTQNSLGIANTFSAKKEPSAKKTENKVSSKKPESRPSSRSVENKHVLTNRQSDLWLSSFLKETAAEVDKDTILAMQEKNSEYCLEDIEEKLSDSTDGDGDDDTNDEDGEGPTKKETRAPLELMAEFLRAEMGQDYQLAKKLCQMILIYEPENPVAKEFLSLIEEILLKEKDQKQKDDEEESEEGTSSESDAESSEEGSQDSSDECENGS
ncbi:Glutamate-rich protein 2 [Lemmus lemmus]